MKKTTTKTSSPKNKFLANRSMRLSFKQGVSFLLLLSIVMLSVSGWFWWRSIFTDPDRVLAGMLARSLQTNSITRRVSQQDQQSKLDQSVRLDLSPNGTSQTVTALSQREQNGISQVTTETIGTKKEDFVRYRNIESPSVGADKNTLGKVLNTWGKRDTAGQPPAFLNEATLSIVPFGNLKKEDRKAVLDILKAKKVYTYSKANRETRNGRQVLVYQMAILPQGLVEALAAYSKLSGLGEQPELDPKAYADVPPINVEMTIDILSRDLLSIKYVDSERFERYLAGGLLVPISVPEQTIAFTELQKRLQDLQQK